MAAASEPNEIAVGSRQLKLIFAGLMLGVLLASLDQTVVITALPTIVGDLGGLNHLSWVVTSYLLAATVVTPLYGKFGDLYGRKTLFQVAVVIFIVGSVLSGIAQSMVQLIAFRAIQGCGAGGLTVGPQAIIGDIIPPADRGRYSGLMASVYAIASVIGPLVGGFFTVSLSWRWVFYINIPLGLITLVVIAFVLPASRSRTAHRIDFTGIALLAASASSLILLLSWGGTEYAWGSLPIVLLAVTTVGLGYILIVVERRATEPVVPPRLFRSGVFNVAAGANAVVSLLMIGMVTFLPLFLQTVHLVSPTLSGVETAPIVICLLACSIWGGRRVASRGQYKIYPVVGSIFMVVAVALVAYTGTGLTTPYWRTAIGMALLGAGIGLSTTVYVLAIQNSVPYKDMGAAIATSSFARAICGAMGVAIFGAIFANSLGRQLRHQGGSLAGLRANAMHLTPAQLRALRHTQPSTYESFIQAFNHALHTVFLAAIPFGVLALVLAVMLKEIPLRRTAGAAAAELDPGLPLTAPDSAG
jgi:EmrB/QacA subfamily drug resistance transporter